MKYLKEFLTEFAVFREPSRMKPQASGPTDPEFSFFDDENPDPNADPSLDGLDSGEGLALDSELDPNVDPSNPDGSATDPCQCPCDNTTTDPTDPADEFDDADLGLGGEFDDQEFTDGDEDYDLDDQDDGSAFRFKF